jgi:hypothetical protein
MKFIKIVSAIILVALIGVFLAAQFIFIKIELGQTGVRTQQYAFLGEKGVVPEDFGPGWHRNLP